MPTAARLAAALFLALTAFATAFAAVPLIPEHLGRGRIYEVSIVLALIVGWFPMGRNAGGGLFAGIANGITGGVILVFCAVFGFGFMRMWTLAFRKKYDTLMDAVAGFTTESLTYASYFQDLTVLSTVIIGSVLTGIIADVAARRFS